MKKTLALILALVMVFALCACGGSKTEEPAAPEAPAAAPEAAAPEAAAPEAAAPEAPAAEGDDFAEWKEYLKEYAIAGAPSEEAGKSVADAIDAAATAADVEAIPEMTVLFSDVGVLAFDAWVEAGKPAADTANMGSPSGEPSGEPTEEPAA
jgi:hypothetical protein